MLRGASQVALQLHTASASQAASAPASFDALSDLLGLGRECAHISPLVARRSLSLLYSSIHSTSLSQLAVTAVLFCNYSSFSRSPADRPLSTHSALSKPLNFFSSVHPTTNFTMKVSVSVVLCTLLAVVYSAPGRMSLHPVSFASHITPGHS